MVPTPSPQGENPQEMAKAPTQTNRKRRCDLGPSQQLASLWGQEEVEDLL